MREPKCWCGHLRDQHHDGSCGMPNCDCCLYLTKSQVQAGGAVFKPKSGKHLKILSRDEWFKRRQLAFGFLKTRKSNRFAD